MESIGLFEMMVIVSISVGGAAFIAVGFWLVSTWDTRQKFAGTANVTPTFLFDGVELRDATPDAQLLISNAPDHMNAKQSVVHILGTRFPTLEKVIDTVSKGNGEKLTATDNTAISLEVTEIDGLIQLKLLGTNTKDNLTISEIAAQDALLKEVSMLRDLMAKSPYLVWQQDGDGTLNWANDAYLNLSDTLSDDQVSAKHAWRNMSVFPDVCHKAIPDDNNARRVSVDIPSENGEAWFDVTTVKSGGSALHFASNANKAVTAEREKRQSIQNFGRIFARLSTGLAIFDEKRRLTMFNPALIDLTSLSPEFLSSKPSIQMFLDRLREARLLPEPKDYTKWREQFCGTDTSTDAPYCQAWEIANGQTFKVTGQPNRDNTYALFFEDISSEISLNRRFRSDIETGQSVLDALPEAIAVFSANGTLVMSNRTYSKLWDIDPKAAVRNHDLRAEMLMWQSQCAAAPIWRELRDFIGRSGQRDVWTDRAVLDDGRQITCKAQPIAGGMTMISFVTSTRIHSRAHNNISIADPSIYGYRG